MTALSLAVWLVGALLNVQTTQACTGECPRGFKSVCVQRGSDCNCSCVKTVEAGITALRNLFQRYSVSSQTVNDAARRYREFASGSSKFSFTVEDQGQRFTVLGSPVPSRVLKE